VGRYSSVAGGQEQTTIKRGAVGVLTSGARAPGDTKAAVGMAFDRPYRGRGEMVDARDLKSLGGNPVRVRVPPSAPVTILAPDFPISYRIYWTSYRRLAT
jgi:hypothetical protein